MKPRPLPRSILNQSRKIGEHLETAALRHGCRPRQRLYGWLLPSAARDSGERERVLNAAFRAAKEHGNQDKNQAAEYNTIANSSILVVVRRGIVDRQVIIRRKSWPWKINNSLLVLLVICIELTRFHRRCAWSIYILRSICISRCRFSFDEFFSSVLGILSLFVVMNSFPDFRRCAPPASTSVFFFNRVCLSPCLAVRLLFGVR